MGCMIHAESMANSNIQYCHATTLCIKWNSTEALLSILLGNVLRRSLFNVMRFDFSKKRMFLEPTIHFIRDK